VAQTKTPSAHTRPPRDDSPRRKEVGALIATAHGIYAASQFLRHSDITTTARHYAQHKARISVGLGKLLETEIKPVSAQEAPA